MSTLLAGISSDPIEPEEDDTSPSSRSHRSASRTQYDPDSNRSGSPDSANGSSDANRRPAEQESDQDRSSAGQRRHRPSEFYDEPEPARKRALVRFATDMCERFGLSQTRQDEIVEAATLPPAESLLFIMVQLALLFDQKSDVAGTRYLESAEFKNHIVTRIYPLLLNPDRAQYKTGLTDRYVRHIRSHAGQYKVPADARDYIQTQAFRHVISGLLTTARSELKRRLVKAWDAKLDIYATVNELTKMAKDFDVVPATWARWAWIALMLNDYHTMLRAPDSTYKENGFWDYVDEKLAERRDSHPELDEDARKERNSTYFENILAKHKILFPPITTKKSTPPHAVQVWQKNLARAVQEMNGYDSDDDEDAE